MVVALLVRLARICASTQELCIEGLVINILLPSRNQSITVGVLYKPPNQASFMDLMVEKFSNLNLKDNEYILLVILTLIFFKTVITF